eukprot:362338-Pleurochrysis_carterae.AAC.1
MPGAAQRTSFKAPTHHHRASEGRARPRQEGQAGSGGIGQEVWADARVALTPTLLSQRGSQPHDRGTVRAA